MTDQDFLLEDLVPDAVPSTEESFIYMLKQEVSRLRQENDLQKKKIACLIDFIAATRE